LFTVGHHFRDAIAARGDGQKPAGEGFTRVALGENCNPTGLFCDFAQMLSSERRQSEVRIAIRQASHQAEGWASPGKSYARTKVERRWSAYSVVKSRIF